MCPLVYAQSVYHIEAPFLPWLWPLLDICGLTMLLAGLIFRRLTLLPTAMIPLFVGCYMERDLTLAIGTLFAAVLIGFYILKSRP